MARRRSEPDGVFVALFLYLGWVVLGSAFRWWWYRVVRPMFRLHQRVVRPTHRHMTPDPLVERLAVARSVVGLILLVVVDAVWRDARFDALSNIADHQLAAVYQNATWLVALFVAVSLLLVGLARRGHRKPLLVSLGAPAGAVGLVVGTFTVLVGGQPLLVLGASWGSAGEPSGGLILAMVVAHLAVAAVAIPWFMITMFYTLPLMVAHYCRAIDGHPTMRALLALGLASVLVAMATLRWVDASADHEVPLLMRLCLSFGGPLLVAALAVWELRRLRSRGVTLRWPVPA